MRTLPTTLLAGLGPILLAGLLVSTPACSDDTDDTDGTSAGTSGDATTDEGSSSTDGVDTSSGEDTADAESPDDTGGTDGAPDPAALEGPARIVFDADGIPHIYATTNDDVYFLQGYAAASQRLFQMDLTRRRALGRRAEILGEKFYASDIQSRALRFDHWGQLTADALTDDDPTMRLYFDAYVAGVNTYIERALAGTDGANLSPQFDAVGFQPEMWTVADVLAMEKMLTAGLAMRADQDIILGLVHLLLGDDFFTDFYRWPMFDLEHVVPNFREAHWPAAKPSSPSAEKTALRQSSLSAMQTQLAQLDETHLANLFALGKSIDMSYGGSNNWAVSGEHTESGHPIIAGDSHQGVSHPAVYYYVHLNTAEAGGELDVIGSSFPGLPFVLFGHNGTAAWMPTTNIYDAADVYLESLNTQAGTVTWNGEEVPIDVRELAGAAQARVSLHRGCGRPPVDDRWRTTGPVDDHQRPQRPICVGDGSGRGDRPGNPAGRPGRAPRKPPSQRPVRRVRERPVSGTPIHHRSSRRPS